MTHILRLYLILQQSVFAVIFCIQNLPFFLLFGLLFNVLFLQQNYRIGIIFNRSMGSEVYGSMFNH